MTTNPIKYVEVRIEQLKEEYSKNPSEENAMIFDKAVMDLMTVLDLLKRDRNLSMNPYKYLTMDRMPTEGEALLMMLTILLVGTVLLNWIVSLFI